MAVGDEHYLRGDSNRDGSLRVVEVANSGDAALPDVELQMRVNGSWRVVEGLGSGSGSGSGINNEVQAALDDRPILGFWYDTFTAAAGVSPASGTPATVAEAIGQIRVNTSVNPEETWRVQYNTTSNALEWAQDTVLTGTEGQILGYDATPTEVAYTHKRVLCFKSVGTDLAALANTAFAYRMPTKWKVTGFEYKIAGTGTTPAIAMSLKKGEGGTAMTGASAVSLSSTTRTSTTAVTAGNTGLATDLIELAFGAITGTTPVIQKVDLDIFVEQTGLA